MQWVSQHISDDRIITTSAATAFRKCNTLKNGSGVYLLMDKDQHVKFVGKADNDKMLEEIDNAIADSEKSLGATKVKALYTESGETALSLKKHFVRTYNPPNNFK